MDITLLYFDGCPNWQIADRRLAQIAADRPDVHVTRHRLETVEEAERVGFHGSPTILINGVDGFAARDAPVALTCRLYTTPDGLAGAPTLDQLRALVERA